MDLRDYQHLFVDAAHKALSNGSRSTLGVLPTGGGKTICFAHLVQCWLREHPGTRALILAHREELIFQARDKYELVAGERPDIEMAEFRASRHGLLSNSGVVVSSVQTQNAGPRCRDCEGKGCNLCLDGTVRRMQRFDPMEFSLLILDECHHATAGSWRRVIDYYSRNPALRILGVTATPDRHDEEALGRIFDSVAFEYGLVDAITDGWLVPIRQEWVVCESLDFSQVRTKLGDLHGADLERAMTEEKALHEVTTPTVEIAGDRPTLVFAAGVAHAHLMAEIFNRHKKNSAICIDGKTDSEDRRHMLAEFAAGKYQFLCNCGVFLEGFDEPRIEVIAMARPTKSRALYSQCVGRGTRPIDAPSQDTPELRRAAIAGSRKPECVVLDFVGNSGRHKLISTADILGGKYTDDIVAAAVAKAKKRGGTVDMLEELKAAEQECEEERQRRRKKITAAAHYTRQIVNPFDVLDLVPAREPGWFKGRRPSEKMIAMLDRAGVKNPEKMTFTAAKQIIGEIVKRRENDLCSYKQAKLLAKYGQNTNLGFKEASVVIDAIAKNGWKPIETVSV